MEQQEPGRVPEVFLEINLGQTVEAETQLPATSQVLVEAVEVSAAVTEETRRASTEPWVAVVVVEAAWAKL
jgi:hypothetical protein